MGHSAPRIATVEGIADEIGALLGSMLVETVDHADELSFTVVREDLANAMVALRDMGVDVPSQVAVAGFDNIPLARLISPGLTTMAVDIADMGARGINRLVALIDGEAVPQMELRQPGLIIRTSSQLSAA